MNMRSVLREAKSVGAKTIPAGVAEPALPGRRRGAPSGGSAVHAVTSVGATVRREGPPRASTAPSRGSVVHAVTSVGATS